MFILFVYLLFCYVCLAKRSKKFSADNKCEVSKAMGDDIKVESLNSYEMPEIVIPKYMSCESILNPENRKFLEEQGKQDDQNNTLSLKRLIIGSKSYKFEHDSDPLAV